MPQHKISQFEGFPEPSEMRKKTHKPLSHHSSFKINPSNDLCTKTTVMGFRVRKWKKKRNLIRRVLFHITSLQRKALRSPKIRSQLSLHYPHAYRELETCWWSGCICRVTTITKRGVKREFSPSCLWVYLLFHPGSNRPTSRLDSKAKHRQNMHGKTLCHAGQSLFSSLVPTSLSCLLVMFEMQRWLLFPALEGLGHVP